MKNLSFLSIALLTFFVLFFSACKKDDELSTRDKLIGKWNYELASYEDYENGELVDSGSDPIVGATIEFKENGTLVANFIDREDGSTQTDNGVWSLDGDNITIGEVGDSETGKISEITTEKMTLAFEEEFTDDGTTYLYKSEVRFTKQ
jgi:hypothetical protein